MQIYVNKIKNRIVSKIKTGYKLKLLSPETMNLFGSTIKDVDRDKDGENIAKLKSAEVVLVHCNLVLTISNKHLKYYLLLHQINNLAN